MSALFDHAQSMLGAWAPALWLLAVASGVMFIASVVLIPIVLVRLPPEYFQGGRSSASRQRSGPIKLAIAVARNVLGIVLLASGILMLILPGQGLLTIAAALILLDFPGKRSVIYWIATRSVVFDAANRIRGWRGYPPFAPPRR